MDLQSTLGTASQSFRMLFKGLSDDMQMCIQNCSQCSQVCEQVIQHCLKKGGMHADLEHIRLLQDCREICAASAGFMIRSSEYHSRVCAVCAEVCLACAQDCEQMPDDEVMKGCADICHRCADSCQKMSVAH